MTVPLVSTKLASGDYYSLGVTDGRPWLAISVSDNAEAVLDFTPAEFSQFRLDCSRVIVASKRTKVELDADVIAQSLRIALGRLEELKKRAPAEVARVYGMLVAHARSACPEAFREMTTEVLP